MNKLVLSGGGSADGLTVFYTDAARQHTDEVSNFNIYLYNIYAFGDKL